MKLVIVESPTKAKTISRFLGKDYQIESSYGHVRDLPQKKLGVDVKNNFKPQYVISEKARKRVSELKKKAQRACEIILATDEDREGEAISWHLSKILRLQNDQIKRITFHEITKPAILKALKNPRQINLSMVNAQQARRILDRLFGYKLSPFLWKKIRKGLSAGRVQSVALRLIVEREREIENFKSQEYWEIIAKLQKENETFEAKLWKKDGKTISKYEIKNQKEVEEIRDFLKKAEFSVQKIIQKEISKNPPAPFTTSTLQQAASSIFGFSPKKTMRLAQQLYEGVELGKSGVTGLITYMRTDSVTISALAAKSAQKIIQKKFGKNYCVEKPRSYKSRTKNSQEAHEAIRPTFLEKEPDLIAPFLSVDQLKLYSLIWNRTLASQMASAKINSLIVEILAKNKSFPEKIFSLKATGSTIKFDGYLALLSQSEKRESFLPDLSENDSLKLKDIVTQQKFTQPPSRYSEAMLVKALEEKGIGRPSTYAPTISIIQERDYVKKDKNKKLFPTEIGKVVSDLLVNHFGDIVDYQLTAKLEKELDSIAQGKTDWIEVIKNFYDPFAKNLSKKIQEIKKENFQKKIDKKCPLCGAELVEKFGRFGKFISCEKYPTCQYTDKSLEEKQEEEAVKKNEGNENGKIICEKCGAEMVLKNGPFGKFLGCSNYPNCKNIKKIETKLGIKCPQCHTGELVEKRSKKGKKFYACNLYPQCNFALWQKPIGEKCPQCQSLLVFAAKNKIRCSNKACGFEKEIEKSFEK